LSRQLTYLPRLDSLRAIAALMVLVCHYLIDVKSQYNFHYGGGGVDIFFVISGFLITSILLAQKNESALPKFKIIGNFIVKRALRLFPVYYLLLIVLGLLSVYGGLWLCTDGKLWHYFTYTQNILFFYQGTESPLLFHTWSLAVEEQFYICWPFLILFTPKRAELFLLISIFISGYFFRYAFSELIVCPGTAKGITLIHLDTLGAGALLGWCRYYGKEIITRFMDRWSAAIFAISLPVSLFLSYQAEKTNPDIVLLPTVVTIMSLALVWLCTKSGPALLDPIFNSALLQRIGKISYGLYLLHKPVPFFFRMIWSKLGFAPITNPTLLFVIYFAIAFVLATASWHFIESKVLKLKARFDR
jgi:peptidoglycan/LPS O-acetylase OafA/YrhL